VSQLPLAEIRRLQTVQHIVIIIIVITMVHWSQCSDRSHAHLLTPLLTARFLNSATRVWTAAYAVVYEIRLDYCDHLLPTTV